MYSGNTQYRTVVIHVCTVENTVQDESKEEKEGGNETYYVLLTLPLYSTRTLYA
jgi:hypothetical protein